MRKLLVASLVAALGLVAGARTPQSDGWLAVTAKRVESDRPRVYQFRDGVSLHFGTKDAVLVADEADLNNDTHEMELRGNVKISAVAVKGATVTSTLMEGISGGIHVKGAQFKAPTFVLTADEAQNAFGSVP